MIKYLGSKRRLIEHITSDIEPEALRLLHLSMERLGLSLRAYVKVLKVSRTIADLDGQDRVTADHVAEAVQYRLLDRDPGAEEAASGRRRAPISPSGISKYA